MMNSAGLALCIAWMIKVADLLHLIPLGQSHRFRSHSSSEPVARHGMDIKTGYL